MKTPRPRLQLEVAKIHPPLHVLERDPAGARRHKLLVAQEVRRRDLTVRVRARHELGERAGVGLRGGDARGGQFSARPSDGLRPHLLRLGFVRCGLEALLLVLLTQGGDDVIEVTG